MYEVTPTTARQTSQIKGYRVEAEGQRNYVFQMRCANEKTLLDKEKNETTATLQDYRMTVSFSLTSDRRWVSVNCAIEAASPAMSAKFEAEADRLECAFSLAEEPRGTYGRQALGFSLSKLPAHGSRTRARGL